MNFFRRKHHPVETTATAPEGREKHGRRGPWSSRERHAATAVDESSYNRRPRFGQWLKGSLVDLVTMVAMGAIGLGVS
jgi:diacylglycerol diphosphate phosphatase / phosphatidate phosphatase